MVKLLERFSTLMMVFKGEVKGEVKVKVEVEVEVEGEGEVRFYFL